MDTGTARELVRSNKTDEVLKGLVLVLLALSVFYIPAVFCLTGKC